jgi:hypothetical protein
MASNAELAYTGLTVLQEELEPRFVLRAAPGVKAKAHGRTNGKTNGKAPARTGATTSRPAAPAR